MKNCLKNVVVSGGLAGLADKETLMVCIVCQSWCVKSKSSTSLCVQCERCLKDLAQPRWEDFCDARVRVIFPYEGLVRRLIMRSKVKNDAVAAGVICHIVKNALSSDVDFMPYAEHLIIPAPASTWGRVRGRFDLAELLVRTVFTHDQIVQTLLPRLALKAKRAGRNAHDLSRTGRHSLNNKNFNVFNKIASLESLISGAKRILVVDDVMTTGLTMRTIFNQLKELGAQSVEGLVIASSS
jgi:predicted amidophosphoribosyltransferase